MRHKSCFPKLLLISSALEAGDRDIPGSSGNAKEPVEKESVSTPYEDALEAFPTRRNNFFPSVVSKPESQPPNGSISGSVAVAPVRADVTRNREDTDRANQKIKSLAKSSLAGSTKSDVLARKFKKAFAKSSENKMRDLFAFVSRFDH